MLPPIMAVNGPPNGEVELHLPISPDPSYYHHPPSPPSPLLGGKSSPPDPPSSPPDPPSSPGPVSPGKKRVRISDSTSVRVIEDPPCGPPRAILLQPRTYYQQFNSEYIHRLHQDNSPRPSRPPRHFSPHGDGDDHVGQNEEDAGWGEYGGQDQTKEYDYKDYPQDDSGVEVHEEYTEYLSKEEDLTCLEDESSTGVQSLESRDNPFLPGGDLSKEAEDLLSKATIVRDKFYLHQQRQQHDAAADPTLDPTRPAPTSPKDVADGALANDSKHPAAVEERITPTSAAAARVEARPDPHPRENGKASSSDGVSSPDGVRVEVGAEGSKGAGSDGEGEEKDKPKRRAKCCVVM